MPYTSRSGVQLYYETIGDCSSKLPIMLHHGFGNSVSDWHKLGYVERLSPHFSLVLYDCRGHGQSEKPHDPKYYTPECIAQDCLAILDELDIPQCHFLGNSMGGIIGLLMAQVAPERYCSFMIGGTYPKGGPFIKGQTPLLQEGIEKGGLHYVETLEAEFVGCQFPDSIRDDFINNDLHALLAACQTDWPNNTALFGQLTMPRWLYVGEYDIWLDDMKLLSSQSNVELEVLKGLNHTQAYCDSNAAVPLIQSFVDRL